MNVPFSKMCIRDRGKTESSKFYIGRFTFKYENELLIFDWRAPVSSMFYDYEVGPAAYDRCV